MVKHSILEKSTCDNRICHEHVEPYAHKEPLWYICTEVKWPTQRAYFRRGKRGSGWYMPEPYPWKSGTLSSPSHNWEIFERPDPWQTSFFIPTTRQIRVSAFSAAAGIKREWKREVRAIHEVDNPRWRVIASQHDTACVLIANGKKKILAVQFETRARRTTFT